MIIPQKATTETSKTKHQKTLQISPKDVPNFHLKTKHANTPTALKHTFQKKQKHPRVIAPQKNWDAEPL